jgi:phosphate starvation-inducible PhoH-like protein
LTFEPKSKGQIRLIKTIKHHDVVFVTGPAGTGKTYVTVVQALESIMQNHYGRLMLTRPAVTAGEKIGYVPGTEAEKFEPFMVPLMEAIQKASKKKKNLKQFIHLATIAYMRGRTFENCFMILDESQNVTIAQMKMYLTRIGKYSKMVIIGDETQTDLRFENGLKDALDRLAHVKSIGFVTLDSSDNQRHDVVPEIVKAYEADDAQAWEDIDEEEDWFEEVS